METFLIIKSVIVLYIIVSYFQDDSSEQASNSKNNPQKENNNRTLTSSSKSRQCAQCGDTVVGNNKYCGDCKYGPLLDDGWHLFDREEYEKARQKAKEAMQKRSGSVGARCLYASAESNLGNWEEAAEHFEKALSAGVDEPAPIHAELARAYGMMGDSKGAIREATASLEENPNYVAYIQRGYAKLDHDHVDDASGDFRKASDLEPENLQPWLILAKTAYEKGDPILLEECIDNLEHHREWNGIKGLKVSLHELKQEWEAAVELGEDLVEDCADNEIFAKSFLASCHEADPEAGAEAVSVFDEHHLDDGQYQFISGTLLLNVGREDDTLSRISTVREIADDELDKEVTRQFFLVLDVLEITAEYTADRSSLDRDEVERLLDRTEQSDDKFLHICWCTLSALKGLLEYNDGNLEEALQWLERSEETEELITRDLTAEVRETIWDIHRKIAEIDLDSDAGDVPVYELLKKADELLAETHRLPEYERRTQSMLEHFDDPPLVSVMGEYSVGKSTFINALLGAELLPTGEGVTTGTVVWLRYAENRRARVVYHDDHVVERNSLSDVDALVREDEEGQTARDIRHVELFLDAPILRRINIVDTPGLNAPFPEHAETTEEFLEKSDAILFLFNVEAAGKATEGEFLEKVKKHRRKALAIVNQIDLVPSHEIDDVLEFIREDFGDLFPDVLGVSGQLALEAALENDETKRNRSRLDELEEHLEENLLDDARRIKKESLETKFLELVEDLEERHQQFKAELEKTLDGLERFASAGRQWFHEDMSEVVDQRTNALSPKVDVTFEELAAELARDSEGRGEMPSKAATQVAEQELKTELRSHWEEFRRSFTAAYEEFFEDRIDQLDSLVTDSELEAIHDQTEQMRLRIETWKQEIDVHFESVDSYLNGYLAGNGLRYSVFNTERRRYDNPKSVANALGDQLDFAKTRPARELRKWAQRTHVRFDQEVYELEKTIQEEATRELNEVYRPVLQLADLVETDDEKRLENNTEVAEATGTENLEQTAKLFRPKKLEPTP